MNITFLGTDCFRPQADNDASGFLINGKYLIDTGYFLGHNLTKLGIDLLSVDRVFFTHMHHDHYLALPHLLFHWLQNGKTRSLDEMHIYGPKNNVREVVDLALAFLQAGSERRYYKTSSHPIVHEIEADEELSLIAEFDDVMIEACRNNHAIDGIAFRITERATGKVLGITGDTFYAPHLPDALRNCDLLVHENTRVTSKTDYSNPPQNGHSSIYDSMRTAMESGAKRMAVVHFAASHAEDVIRTAAGIGDVEVFCPEPLKVYEV